MGLAHACVLWYSYYNQQIVYRGVVEVAVYTDDVVEFKLFQLYLSQEVLNVFQYGARLFPAGLSIASLGVDLMNHLTSAMKLTQNSSLTYVRYSIANLTNNQDYYEDTLSQAGSRSVSGDNAAPSFVAASYIYTRSTKLTRNGFKRVSGLLDSDMDGNNATTAYRTLANTLANALAADVIVTSGGGSAYLQPVIVGRDGLGRYDLNRVVDVSGVKFVRITTQASRRAGHGR